ncbi:MAG: TetR/AcrR family transcriptional regulator [Deltaproteobacteria bacterium]|nr:TetR/AcrR family transcriptional regulator [Deltaproteobacteria bacterium]MBW2068009.1 TetR/AcrR family transcriptional regulator [Deltaproteobacteria bacterium]
MGKTESVDIKAVRKLADKVKQLSDNIEKERLIQNFLESVVEEDKDVHPLMEELQKHLPECLPFLRGLLQGFNLASGRSKGKCYQSYDHTEIRERILDAALKVFSTKGYYETKMDWIAREAGVGKGTLYRHFKSKEELYRYLIDSRLSELKNKINEIIHTDKDVLEILSECFAEYFRFFQHYRGLYRLILSEEVPFEGGKYIKAALRNIYPIKHKLFNAAQKGQFKQVNFETAFYGFMGFLHGVVQKWLDHGCNYDLMDELPVVTEILLHGVKTERR